MSEIAVSLDSLKTMAQKVRFVSFDVIQYQDKEIKSHWYKHDSIDLYYFQRGDGGIVKLHICIMGQILEWNPFDGVRTGLVIEEERAGGVFEIIQYDSRASYNAQAQSLLILSNAFLIEADIREKLICCLENKKTGSIFFSFLTKLFHKK